MESVAVQFLSSIFITVIGFLLSYFFNRKPKLLFLYTAVGEVPINQVIPNISIRTHTLMITNQGNLTAYNLRIGHNFLPNYSIMPAIALPLDEKSPKGEICIPNLTPKESIFITYVYRPEVNLLDINKYIKSDEMQAQPANLEHVNLRSPFIKWVFKTVFFIGVLTIVYWTINIVNSIMLLQHLKALN